MSRRFGFILLLAIVVVPAAGAAQTPLEANEAGKAAYQRGDFATAERWFAAAAAAVPNEPLYHYHRGAALVRLGRYPEARAAYGQARALKPPAPLATWIEQALRDLGRSSMRAPDAGEYQVPIESFNGVWLTEVVLNGGRRARFLVDTGATACAIAPALAEELGMQLPGNAPLVKIDTAGGVIEGHLSALQSVRVGEVEAHNVVTVVHPFKFQFDGILGNSFLARYAATLDAQRRILHLKSR